MRGARLLLVILIVVLPGCTDARNIPALRVAAHVWPGYELMFMAEREGWFDAAAVELRRTGSASESMDLLRKGTVEAAALTYDEALRLKAEGLALRVVLVFNVSSGADMVLGRGDVQHIGSLPQRRVGVEQSALGALMLTKALRAGGLGLDDVHVVPLTVDLHLDAWRRGEVDALVTFEPVASALLAEGATKLFDSSAIPDTIHDVLVVREEALAKRVVSAAMGELVAAHLRGVSHLRTNPVDAGFRLAVTLGGDGAAALRAYQGLVLPDANANRRLLDPANTHLETVAAQLFEVMTSIGLIDAVPDVRAIATPDYLPGASARRP